jgi:hypothetical protein
MALSKEDYNDVKGAMGKALAKRVSKATKDGGKFELHTSDKSGNLNVSSYRSKKRALRTQKNYMKGNPGGSSSVVHGGKKNPDGRTMRSKGPDKHQWEPYSG